MKLTLPTAELEPYISAPVAYHTHLGLPDRQEKAIPVEHSLSIYINEVPSYQLVCTPDLLPELVLGRLLTDGVIASTEEVEGLHFCREGLRARVFLAEDCLPNEQPALPPPEPTCCTDNRVLSVRYQNRKPLPHLPKLAWKREWIFSLARSIITDTPLHRITPAVHSCLLMHRGEVLVCSEDIGRHNALDKVLGWALLHQVPLGECILYTSGRVPVDMTAKAIRAGVPVLVSKSLPTAQALALAETHGLTLIGSARPDELRVFCP